MITKRMVLTGLAVLVLLLAACSRNRGLGLDLEALNVSIQQRVLDLEAKGVSITTTPVSIFSDHDFCAVPVGLTIRLDVDRDMVLGSEWGIADESDVQFIVDTLSELFDYFNERRIPIFGITGIQLATSYPSFSGALAARGLSATFFDMYDTLVSEHPVRITSMEVQYNASRKIKDFLEEGNMLWLEDFGIEVTLDIIGEPPYFFRGDPRFSSISDVPFGITDQESLEQFMDAVMLLAAMNLGRLGHMDIDDVRYNLGLHRGLDDRTLLELFDEGMHERFREIYGY